MPSKSPRPAASLKARCILESIAAVERQLAAAEHETAERRRGLRLRLRVLSDELETVRAGCA